MSCHTPTTKALLKKSQLVRGRRLKRKANLEINAKWNLNERCNDPKPLYTKPNPNKII
jgi:hypothetical protein